MKKSDYEQAVNRLTNEAKDLEEKEQIGYDTAIFLGKEMKKLDECIENPNASEEEKEIATNKRTILEKRMKYEIKHSSNNDDEASRIERELLSLIKNGYCNE